MSPKLLRIWWALPSTDNFSAGEQQLPLHEVVKKAYVAWKELKFLDNTAASTLLSILLREVSAIAEDKSARNELLQTEVCEDPCSPSAPKRTRL